MTKLKQARTTLRRELTPGQAGRSSIYSWPTDMDPNYAMRDCLLATTSPRTYPATAALSSNLRPRGKQSGLVIAVSLAACLVGNSVLAQTASGLDPSNHPLDQASKRGKNSDRAAKLPIDPQAISPPAPAPAAGPGVRFEKRANTDRGTQTRPQKTVDPFQRYDNLREKGLWFPIPGPADTIDQDKGALDLRWRTSASAISGGHITPLQATSCRMQPEALSRTSSIWARIRLSRRRTS